MLGEPGLSIWSNRSGGDITLWEIIWPSGATCEDRGCFDLVEATMSMMFICCLYLLPVRCISVSWLFESPERGCGSMAGLVLLPWAVYGFCGRLRLPVGLLNMPLLGQCFPLGIWELTLTGKLPPWLFPCFLVVLYHSELFSTSGSL